MILGRNKRGAVTAVVAVSPGQIRKYPVEHLGTMLKSSLIKAEDQRAEEMFVYINIGRLDDDEGVADAGTTPDE